MNIKRRFLRAALAAAFVLPLRAAPPPNPAISQPIPPPETILPPETRVARANSETTPTFNYEQRLFANLPPLVTPERAKAAIDHFRFNFAKGASPRILIWVNPNVDRSQPAPTASLDGRKTVQDIERLFGREFRDAGGALVEPEVAAQVMGGQPLAHFTSPGEGIQARQDREALARIADVVLEIVISTHTMVGPELSGDREYAGPNIQAIAIRAGDSKILGRASAGDLIGKLPLGQAARNFDVQWVAEATALALMENMTIGTPQ